MWSDIKVCNAFHRHTSGVVNVSSLLCVIGKLACVTQGATAVFPADAFEPAAVLETVEQERCTALHSVPTMFIAELEHPEFDWTYDSRRTVRVD